MEPGPDAVKQLEQLHPTARWAWYRREECFALLELYPAPRSGQLLYEQWGQRGPVYGPPFDPNLEQPVWLANFHPRDLQTLSFLPTIKRWRTSMYARMLDSAEEEASEYESDIGELAGEMGKKLYWDGQGAIDSPHLVPYKFLTQREKDSLVGDNMIDVKRAFMPFG